MADADWLFPLAEILDALPAGPDSARVRYAVRHGTMRAGVYAPRVSDPQGPHDQDELYIVASGSGLFVKDGTQRAFKPGDVIFVEAGVPHRFEDFGGDFVTWVIFWGPKGGEP